MSAGQLTSVQLSKTMQTDAILSAVESKLTLLAQAGLGTFSPLQTAAILAGLFMMAATIAIGLMARELKARSAFGWGLLALLAQIAALLAPIPYFLILGQLDLPALLNDSAPLPLEPIRLVSQAVLASAGAIALLVLLLPSLNGRTCPTCGGIARRRIQSPPPESRLEPNLDSAFQRRTVYLDPESAKRFDKALAAQAAKGSSEEASNGRAQRSAELMRKLLEKSETGTAVTV